MPELGPKDLSYSKETRRLYFESADRYVSDIKLVELAKEYDQEFVGKGAEAVVVELPGKSKLEKVVAFTYKDIDPKVVKDIFYLHRLFSTLFPHNFPHFYASSTLGTVRQKINPGRLNSLKQNIKFFTDVSLTKFPFSEVERTCKKLGLGVHVDINDENFIFGSDGGEYYVDTLIEYLTIEYQNIDVSKIIEYMKNGKYSQEDIEIVRLSVERLKTLNKSSEK